MYKNLVIKKYRLWLRRWRELKRFGPCLSTDIMAIAERNQDLIEKKTFTFCVPKALEAGAELCMRQILFEFSRFDDRIVRFTLYYGAGIEKHLVLALPSSWLKVFAEKGCRISRVRSGFYFVRFLIYKYLQGVKSGLFMLRALLSSQLPRVNKPYGVLMRMAPDQCPKVRDSSYRRNFITWYQGWKDRDPRVEEIWAHCYKFKGETNQQGITVVQGEHPFPLLSSLSLRLLVSIKVIWVVVFSGLAMLLGRWHYAIILQDIVHAVYGLHIPENHWGREYIFHCSSPFVRPLWSYLAEAAGARISMLHYSVNSWAVFPDKAPQPVVGGGEGLSSWPCYISMSEDHKRGLQKLRRQPIPVIVDPFVAFSDSGESLDSVDLSKFVALFDVAGWRPLFMAKLGTNNPCVGSDATCKFLSLAIKAIKDRGLKVVYKAKRELHNDKMYLSKSYINLVRSFRNDPDITVLSSAITAQRVIERCLAVVSMPYTSTAVIGKAAGKPSVFFDAVGTVSSVAPLVHGVQVVSGEAELTHWLDHSVLPLLQNSTLPQQKIISP